MPQFRRMALVLALLVLIATMLTTACAADPKTAILGNWQKVSGPNDAPIRYTFFQDGSLATVSSRYQFSGQYAINADTILFKYNVMLPISEEGGAYQYKLSGDQLILTSPSGATITYHKTN